jgi:hypothetical protein
VTFWVMHYRRAQHFFKDLAYGHPKTHNFKEILNIFKTASVTTCTYEKLFNQNVFFNYTVDKNIIIMCVQCNVVSGP